jgi:hypothetical protein
MNNTCMPNTIEKNDAKQQNPNIPHASFQNLSDPISTFVYIYTIWLINIAMENTL